jgi:hypothetical protein
MTKRSDPQTTEPRKRSVAPRRSLGRWSALVHPALHCGYDDPESYLSLLPECLLRYELQEKLYTPITRTRGPMTKQFTSYVSLKSEFLYTACDMKMDLDGKLYILRTGEITVYSRNVINRIAVPKYIIPAVCKLGICTNGDVVATCADRIFLYSMSGAEWSTARVESPLSPVDWCPVTVLIDNEHVMHASGSEVAVFSLDGTVQRRFSLLHAGFIKNACVNRVQQEIVLFAQFSSVQGGMRVLSYRILVYTYSFVLIRTWFFHTGEDIDDVAVDCAGNVVIALATRDDLLVKYPDGNTRCPGDHKPLYFGNTPRRMLSVGSKGEVIVLNRNRVIESYM